MLLALFDPDNSAHNLTNVNGKLFFAADAGVGRGIELWSSDGTIFGTTVVKDIQPGALSSAPDDFKNIGGRLYFSAYTTSHGRELWSSNGTADGTVLERDIMPGVFDSAPQFILEFEDQLMLIANHPTAGRELLAEPAGVIGPTGEGESNELKKPRSISLRLLD